MRAWDKAAEDGIAGAFGMKLLVGLGAWCPTSERRYRYDQADCESPSPNPLKGFKRGKLHR